MKGFKVDILMAIILHVIFGPDHIVLMSTSVGDHQLRLTMTDAVCKSLSIEARGYVWRYGSPVIFNLLVWMSIGSGVKL